MKRENKSHNAGAQPLADDLASPERRDMIRRLVKAGAVLPAAAVIYNASAAAAS